MKRIGTTKRVSLVIILLILLPVLFYSVYEISTLSTSEQIFGEIYRQQLDVILFSLNQYCWDVINDWAGRISTALNERSVAPLDAEPVRTILARIPAIHAVFVADTGLGTVKVISRDLGVMVDLPNRARLERFLSANREKIDRLVRLGDVEYRKIEPMGTGDTTESPGGLMLAFISRGPGGVLRVVGILLDASAFIRDVLGPRIAQAAGDQFDMAVVAKRKTEPVFSTAPVSAEDLRERKDLWLFPDLSLGIRMKGATVEELVRARSARSLVLIVLLDLVLLAGGWLVYRSIRREMELIRLKSDFVSNVSHEIRTPLALIRMFAETLEMGRIPEGPRRQEYYATIVQEAERLTRLVNNILSFSRMEAGRKHYQMQDVDLNVVVSDVLKTYGFHMQSQGFSPEVALATGALTVNADAEAVAEALINVLDNAMKYSGSQRYLAVRTGSADGSAFVEVEDHGVGIPHQYRRKIFETFFRVTTEGEQRVSGSGLGLALVKHIMDAHKGQVDVKSIVTQGSTFRLVFPRHSTEPGS